MRILICNPDTIGDVVLRQPMFEALREGGHDLALIVRPLVAPLVRILAPGARVIPMEVQPYRADFSPQAGENDALYDAVVAFDPEAIIVAPYQWTLLEEHLTRLCEKATTYALTGYLFGDPRHGPRPRSRLRVDHRVDVAEETSEIRKNEAMTSAVLERAVTLPWPSIETPEDSIDAASSVRSSLGIESYDVACVGESPSTEVRNWPLDRWATLLDDHARRSERRILLIGASIERASLEDVQSRMETSASVWTGSQDGSVETLLGLIEGATMYIGRDTGPMHLSAALSKPVLAVFGGGTWPRFAPLVEPSVSLMLGVPCAGCGWVCHLPRSICIKDVPLQDVTDALRALEEHEVTTREIRTIKPTEPQLIEVGMEGARSSRDLMREVAKEPKQAPPAKRPEGPDRSELVERLLNPRIASLEQRCASLDERLESARASERESATRAAALEQRVADQDAELEDLRPLRTQVMNMRAHIADLKSKWTSPEDALALREDLSTTRDSLASAIRDLDALRTALETTASEASAMEESLRAQLEDARSVPPPAGDSPDLVARLRSRILEDQNRITRFETQVRDLQARLARADADRVAIVALSRRHETQMTELRGRLGNLLDSRWRKYGQKIGVVMTLPWEAELRHDK